MSGIKEIVGHAGQANIIVYDPGTADPRSKICICMMYGSSRSADMLQNPFMERFARMGYRAANCAPQNGYFIDQIQWLSECQKWIRQNIPGVEKIVLWGNSRGCNLTSAYQRIAENGASTFQGPEMFLPIPDMDLLPADGIIHCDANYGFMVNHIISLASNLKDDFIIGDRTSPKLDPIAPENGYDPATGAAEYDKDFSRSVMKAQAKRYNRLLKKARERMDIIKSGKGMFKDDEPFTVVMGFGNVNTYQLYTHDIRFFSRTTKPQNLIHKDGSITNEIVKTVRGPKKAPSDWECIDKGFQTRVSEYLYCGMHVNEDEFHYDETGVYGVELDNNFTSAQGNAAYISCPTLAVGRTDGFEFIVAELIIDRSIADVKECIFIEGMTHAGGCSDPDKYGDVAALEYNYIDSWLCKTYKL